MGVNRGIDGFWWTRSRPLLQVEEYMGLGMAGRVAFTEFIIVKGPIREDNVSSEQKGWVLPVGRGTTLVDTKFLASVESIREIVKVIDISIQNSIRVR